MKMVDKYQLQTETFLKTDVRMYVQPYEELYDVIIALNQGTLRIVYWTVFKDTTSESRQISLNKSLKIMYLVYGKSTKKVINAPLVKMVAVDQDNQLRLIDILFAETPNVTVNKASPPLDYFSYDKIVPKGAASPDLWDYWLFGVSDTMTLHGNSLAIKNKVGFIMSTNKNRLSALWELTLDELTATYDNPFQPQPMLQQTMPQQEEEFADEDTEAEGASQNHDETDATLDDQTDPATENDQPISDDENVIDGDGNEIAQIDMLELTLQGTASTLPIDPFTKKNSWISDQKQNCKKDIGIHDVDSWCFYYDIFDTPAVAYLDQQTLSKQVPRKASQCDQDARILYYRIENLSIAEKAIRNICFPKQYEEGITSERVWAVNAVQNLPPELANGERMVIVDKNRYELYWPEEVEPKEDVLTWYILIEEYTDSNIQTGFSFYGNYTIERVNHYTMDFDAVTPLNFTFFEEEKAPDFKVRVTCWSPQCPSYIKHNQYSIYTEIANERVVNNTYVYSIEASQLSREYVLRYTLSVNVTTQTKVNSKINITGDFWTWYEANRFNLPFYAPPTESIDQISPASGIKKKQKSSNTHATEESNGIVKTELQAKLEATVFESVSEWSDSDILTALQEARERLNRKRVENVPKISMDQQGLLTISFPSDIGMPSYLKKEIEALLSENTQKTVARTLERNRRLGIFKKYEYALEPNDIMTQSIPLLQRGRPRSIR